MSRTGWAAFWTFVALYSALTGWIGYGIAQGRRPLVIIVNTADAGVTCSPAAACSVTRRVPP